eukprot:CAMPEP_0175439630 /NCGR_PEP_ID=MMETSP0095-20121207/56645_1 /TAXON_ID=311494 /ORGANISM="Alexandrium monilatum, Strain CCMP3105" /LENGTH=136 /DNA_ID=CAMNT_0016739461 /DNA_START=13 /DNA_END=420 /DNA_ORIENTATION=-
MAFRSRQNHTDAWEKMYQKREKATSGQTVQDPQETLRKMYDKLVTPQLARRGANVPLPTDQDPAAGEKEGKEGKAGKETKAKGKQKLKDKQKKKKEKRKSKKVKQKKGKKKKKKKKKRKEKSKKAKSSSSSSASSS